MIARDEAGFLDRCLASVAAIVDQIVLVDTGSVDDTVAVARRYGALVLEHSWNNDFSVARNVGLDAATGGWILSLDCDEAIAAADHEALLALLDGPQADAYRITTRNYVNETNRTGWTACSGNYPGVERDYAGWFPSTKVRLWRNHPGIRFAGPVHELVENSIAATGGVVGDCLVPVHHFGYVEKQRAGDRYVDVGEAKLAANSEDLQSHYELAIAYRNAGRLEEALERARTVTQTTALARRGAAGQGVYLDRELALLVEADILDRLGRTEEADTAYRDILEEFPASYQALNNLGRLLERCGSPADARRCYELAHGHVPDNQTVAENLRRVAGKLEPSQRLSLCVIARDEEKLLPRCLESVAGVADEIVVVDTGSEDATVEIARRHGALVSRFTWSDDYAAARNAALDLATGDWILCLDADEFVDASNAEKLGRAKELKPDKGLYCTLQNVGGATSSFQQMKMFPNDPAIRFERPVHETVLPALRRLEMPAATTDLVVKHTGYSDPVRVAAKKEQYLAMMLTWHRNHPDDDDLAFRIGHTHYDDGAIQKAAPYFKSIFDLGIDGAQSRLLYAAAAAFHARCLLRLDRFDEAREVVALALYGRSDDAHLHLVAAEVYAAAGESEAALRHAGRAATAKPVWLEPLDANAIAPAARELIERLQASGLGNDAAAPCRLTLCMIVRDEEERLPACLDSVAGLADEIVVVDTGSTDGSVRVAEQYGARIGHFEWCDDFARARNASLELASGDWILWLDADDLLPAEYHARIRQLIDQGREKAYFFALDNRGYENVSCLQMRLFPNLPGITFEMPIHEQITPSLIRLGVDLQTTDIQVVHTGYPTPEVVAAKKERYLGIMERWLQEHPENYIVRSHVALTYHSTGRSEEAIEAYRLIVEESDCLADCNFIVYTTSLLFLGRTLMREGRYEAALERMQQALEIDPDYILTKLSLGELYKRMKNFSMALDYAGQVVDGDRQITFFPIDYNEILYSARVIRAEAFFGLGNPDQAAAEYQQAAAVDTARSTDALGSLSNLYKSLGDIDRAQEMLRQALDRDPENVEHLFNMGVLQLDRRAFDEAARYFDQVLERRVGYPPALLNLGYIAKSTGNLEQAEALYRELAAADEGETEARANLAHLLLDQERYSEAKEFFAQVRARESSLLDINLGFLVTLAAAGDWDAAAGAAAEVLASLSGLPRRAGDLESPQSVAETFLQAGAWLLEQGQPKCAELAVGVAVHLDLENAQAHLTLGEILFETGQYWRAIARFEMVLRAQPDDAAVFQRLGDCYRQLGVDSAAQLAYAKGNQLRGA